MATNIKTIQEETQEELAKKQIGPVIISFSGTTLTEKEKILLANPKVGGVVLFRENWERNSENPKDVLKDFIIQCRTINPNLIFMVDHEGGKVWRFEKGFTKLPSAKSIGQVYDKNEKEGLELAFEMGFTMASELLEIGIDRSLAPVLDLDGVSNVIGKLERGSHKDPKVAINVAGAFIQGMNKAGMPATAKHFPGHGSCLLDSHVASPVDDRPLDELLRDLEPFIALVQKGLLAAVMPAHVIYPLCR